MWRLPIKNTEFNKKRDAVIFGLPILAVWILFMIWLAITENDTAPKYDELSLLVGRVDDISYQKKSRPILLSASNKADRITVSISPIWESRINANLKVGQNVQIRYFRQNFMSGIDAWSIGSDDGPIISYEEFAANIPHSILYKDIKAMRRQKPKSGNENH
jgi:hypothetical protein